MVYVGQVTSAVNDKFQKSNKTGALTGSKQGLFDLSVGDGNQISTGGDWRLSKVNFLFCLQWEKVVLKGFASRLQL